MPWPDTMTDTHFLHLDDRGLITLAGADRVEFLQGLVSNDVAKVSETRAIWAALLTPQGKFRHDFFISLIGDLIVIDGEGGARMMDLGKALRRFVLRADVVLDIDRRNGVFAVFGTESLDALKLPAEPGAARPFAGGIVFVDPRLPGLGARVVAPAGDAIAALTDLGANKAARNEYDRLRIGLGLPDGSRDMMPDKAILLENGFDELGGADWKKGCYMGQELTARTKYRGLVKKRLTPVTFAGEPPENGARVELAGKEAGEMRSSVAGAGLALLRLEALRKVQAGEGTLTAGEVELVPRVPDWAGF